MSAPISSLDRRTLIVGIASFTVLLLIAGGGYRSFTSPSPAIPKTPPDEMRRVHCGTRFSVARPNAWFIQSWQKDGKDFQGMSCSVSLMSENRRALWSILISEEPPNVPTTAIEAKFKDRDAFMVSRRQSAVWLDHPGRYECEIYCEYGEGVWVVIYYHIDDDLAEVPEVMWKYFETFQLH